MPKREITLSEDAVTPYFCEDGIDFQKLLYAEAKAQSHDTEEMVMYVIGARILLHEYLALVLSGDIKPYELDKEFVKGEVKGFKDTMHLVNEDFAEKGVPMFEGNNGKMNIDYEALRKKVENEEGHSD